MNQITFTLSDEQTGAVLACLDAVVKSAPDDLPDRAKQHIGVLESAIADIGRQLPDEGGQ